MSEAAERLAQAVRQRRGELGLTQQQVVTAAGPALSLATYTAIETGRRGNVRITTLAAIDRALEWRPGIAWVYWSGSPMLGSPRASDPVPEPEPVPELCFLVAADSALYGCHQCGVAVIDPDTHNEWHEVWLNYIRGMAGILDGWRR